MITTVHKQSVCTNGHFRSDEYAYVSDMFYMCGVP